MAVKKSKGYKAYKEDRHNQILDRSEHEVLSLAIAKKRKEKQSIQFLFWLVGIAGVLAVILYFVVLQGRIRQVIVEGNDHYSDETIKTMMGIDENTSYLDVFMNQDVDTTAYPYVKSVQINFDAFDRIRVMIEEKEIISYIAFQDRYIALDKDGIVVNFEKDRLEELPVVKGLVFEEVNIGSRLVIDDPTASAIKDLVLLSDKYEQPIDLIRFVYGDANEVELEVGDLLILLGEADDLDRKIKDVARFVRSNINNDKGILDLKVAKSYYILKPLK